MARDFTIPFAAQGDRVEVPDDLQQDGSVSMNQGFGFDYERPNTDPTYKPIARDVFNGLMHDITELLGLLQRQGCADWSPAFSPYALNAVVRHNDRLWRSMVADNASEPSDDTEDWHEVTIGAEFEVQESPTDTTPGRLLAVNAFGLGIATHDISGTDLDALKTSGFYRGNNLGHAPDAGLWHVISMVNGGAVDAQILVPMDNDGAQIHWRINNGAGWQPLRSLWDSKTFNPGNYQSNLGFTPVRQGSPNTLTLAWNGSSIAAYVDDYGQGEVFTDGNAHEKIRAHIAAFGAGENGTYGFFVIGGGSGAALGPGTLIDGAAIGWSDAAGLMYGNPGGTWELCGAVRNGDGESPDSATLCKRKA